MIRSKLQLQENYEFRFEHTYTMFIIINYDIKLENYLRLCVEPQLIQRAESLCATNLSVQPRTLYT
jgi:hypothetical protein